MGARASTIARIALLAAFTLIVTSRLQRRTNLASTPEVPLVITRKKTNVTTAAAAAAAAAVYVHDVPADNVKEEVQQQRQAAAVAGANIGPTHECLNQDFTPVHSISIWTMVTDGYDYVQGAIVLGASIQNHTTSTSTSTSTSTTATAQVDQVIMELVDKPLGVKVWETLHKVGWKRCQVERIDANPNHVPNMARFVDQFTKLWLWGMTTYRTILYLDSDTLVVKNIDVLLQIQLKSKIGATQDFFRRRFSGKLNMGVFVLHPSRMEYNRLLALQRNESIVYEYDDCEQGWVNEVYKNEWQEIGFQFNANLVVYSRQSEYWERHAKDISIIHYTINKPWECSKQYQPICDKWHQVARQVELPERPAETPPKALSPQDIVVLPKQTNGMPCLNEDFSAEHDVAILSMNTGDSDKYYNATLLLGRSVRQHSTVPVDLVLLELTSKPLVNRALLSDWKQCIVKRIPPPRDPARKFVDQFTKLHGWAMTQYKSIVYMDSDVFCIDNIDSLISFSLQQNGIDYRLAATHDFRKRKWKLTPVNTFNLGVFKISPNLTEFKRLLGFAQANIIDYEQRMSEQGWLNVVYENDWTELGFEHNANMAALAKPKQVDRNGVKVIHFTTPKPWDCSGPDDEPVKEYCELWTDALVKYYASGI